MLQVPWACSFGPAVALARGLAIMCLWPPGRRKNTGEGEKGAEGDKTLFCLFYIFCLFFSRIFYFRAKVE